MTALQQLSALVMGRMDVAHAYHHCAGCCTWLALQLTLVCLLCGFAGWRAVCGSRLLSCVTAAEGAGYSAGEEFRLHHPGHW